MLANCLSHPTIRQWLANLEAGKLDLFGPDNAMKVCEEGVALLQYSQFVV